MILVGLHMQNFRRHVDTRIEFGQGVTALLGPNGAGKSTILEAIGFALFGGRATRTAKDQLRWEGAAIDDDVTVRLDWRIGDHAVTIDRSQRGKSQTPTAQLIVDGVVQVPHGAGSNQAVTEQVERLLGLGRDAFFTTAVARQKELSRLVDMGAPERKRLILDMLGVGTLDQAIQKGRSRARDARVRLDALREHLPDAGRLRHDLAAANTDLQAATSAAKQTAAALEQATTKHARLAGELGALRARQQEYNAAKAQREHAAGAIAPLQQQHERLQQEVAAARSAAKRFEGASDPSEALAAAREEEAKARLAANRQEEAARLRAQLGALQIADDPAPLAQQLAAEAEALQQEIQRVREVIAVRSAQAKEIRTRLRKIDGLESEADCPLCGQTVHDVVTLQDHQQVLLARLEGDDKTERAELESLQRRAAEVQATRDQLEQKRRERIQQLAERDGLTKRIAELDMREQGHVPPLAEVQAKISELEAADRAFRALRDQAAALPDLDARAIEVAATIEREVARRNQAEARIEALGFEPATLVEAEKDEQAHAAAVQTAQQADHAAQRALDAAQRTVEDLARRQEELASRMRTIEETEEELTIWNALAAGRGRGLLESFRDHLVGRIGPAISTEASRLLSRFTGGRYNEILLDADYNLYVADGGVPFALDRFSGGESDLVHLAMRLAVSRLLLDRSSAQIQLLALDEVFGSLDAERRDHVLAALHALGSIYQQVLVVTHQEALRDALDHAVVVELEGGIARLRQHNP